MEEENQKVETEGESVRDGEEVEEEVPKEGEGHKLFVDEFKSLVSEEYFQYIKEKQGKIMRRLNEKTGHVNSFNEKMKKQYVSMKTDFQAHISMMKEMKEDLKYIQEKVALIKKKIKSPPPPHVTPGKSQSLAPTGNKGGKTTFSKTL